MFRVDLVDVIYSVGEFWPKVAYPGLACRVEEGYEVDAHTFSVSDHYAHTFLHEWEHDCEARNVDSSMSYLTAGLAALMASTSFF